ncbi:Aste57867_3231 [Aphanomyces stellatus]|uniref:Aste57867_3231 protein n=1 Tax=Aphanomyces stellatus TaxID=120398 RepID=A0A485KF09_9STRA|nr:hypothetical protein As57867_003221 [Aphanomyces stellatus]VFT80405.1 Aste57867_3231 [Aphanomyces stellatus]
MILGNKMNLAEHSEDDFVFHRTAIGLIDAPADWVTAVTSLVVVNVDSMEINAPTCRQGRRARKQVDDRTRIIDGKSVRILIDCGASNLLCRPGLAKKVIRSKEVLAEGQRSSRHAMLWTSISFWENYDSFDSIPSSIGVKTESDLASGYHQMLVVPGARKYTAFRTHCDFYEWSRLMRQLFDKFDFVAVYMDDICVFSRSMDDHVQHLRVICDVLRAEKLYARPSKCAFGVDSVDFLGHTISKDGLHVDQSKFRAIEIGYYHKFIPAFADLVCPLLNIGTKWQWGDDERRAFLTIKLALQQAPVLQLPDYHKPFVVTTDASGYCCGAVISQLDAYGNDRPIAFLSKRLGPHESNWPAHEKELYAIKLALGKWRHYLHGNRFDVCTDNSCCKWFMTTPVLTPKLTRWLEFFSCFDFALHHRPGKLNIVADALSRPPKPRLLFLSIHACGVHCAFLFMLLRSRPTQPAIWPSLLTLLFVGRSWGRKTKFQCPSA